MAAESAIGLSLGAEAECLHGVESSTCLLLAASPSPTPPDASESHPLAIIGIFSADDGCTIELQGEDLVDSSSSGDSGSVVLQQDPVSAQLINNISMLHYQTLSKADHLITRQDVECKANGNVGRDAANRKLPKFVTWNWTLVRKVLLWVVVSALVACTGVVIAMIATLPRSCDPQLPWYQGSVFYEVFPASFENSNNDAYGDLKGLVSRLDYIKGLGVSAVRLNYIFEASDYPEHYKDVRNLTSIARVLGTMNDFQHLVTEIHVRNMSIMLDVPVGPAATVSNDSEDELARALVFWSSERRVDGFYLKGLENRTEDEQLADRLRSWKRAIGYGKVLMVSEEALMRSSGTARAVMLSKVELVDVHLDATGGAEALEKQIGDVLSGPLFTEPSRPCVHWNLGDVSTERLGSERPGAAAALLLLEMSLPGTVGIFYGDEISLPGLAGAEPDFPERESVHNVVAMVWRGRSGHRGGVLPWNTNAAVEPDFASLDIVKAAIALKRSTATLYSSWIRKEDRWSGNAQVRAGAAAGAGVVVERWYPRRNSYVSVTNVSPHTLVADLSSLFYSGTVVAATNTTTLQQYIYFDSISLAPYEAIIVKLEK